MSVNPSITLTSSVPPPPPSEATDYRVTNQLDYVSGQSNDGIALVERAVDGKVLVRKSISNGSTGVDNPDEVRRELQINRFLSQFRHPNIVECTAAFLSVTNGRMSRFRIGKCKVAVGTLYMEPCDLGSFADACNRTKFLPDGERELCPEAFIWHALECAFSALVFLHTGFRSISDFLASDPRQGIVPGWTPVKHNDVWLPNIFLKSRTDNSSTNPYPLVLLGDFGSSMILSRRSAMEGQEQEVKALLATLKASLEQVGFLDRYSSTLQQSLFFSGNMDLRRAITQFFDAKKSVSLVNDPLPKEMLKTLQGRVAEHEEANRQHQPLRVE